MADFITWIKGSTKIRPFQYLIPFSVSGFLFSIYKIFNINNLASWFVAFA